MLYLIILGWLACGVLAAGIQFAYFQGKYKGVYSPREELGESLSFGLIFGPVALVIAFFGSGFMEYGWRLWDKK